MAKISTSRSLGFTLIETLVVMLIISILTAILVPAVSKATQVCRATREMAAGQQLMVAYLAYANDSRGRVLPGLPTASMVQTGVVNASGETLTGPPAQRYPWRIAPYINYNFRGLYASNRQVADMVERQAYFQSLGVNTDYIISLYPSLALNVAFVGGSERHGGWDPLFTSRFGRVYLEKDSDANRPGDVIVFASARAEALPGLLSEPTAEGHFRLEPPRFAASQPLAWEASYDPKSVLPGSNSGFVSLRNLNRAVTTRFDGHATQMDWDALRDMRSWADQATSADWGVTPR